MVEMRQAFGLKIPFLDRVIIGWVRRREAEDDGGCDVTLWLEVVGDIGGLVGEEVEEGKNHQWERGLTGKESG